MAGGRDIALVLHPRRDPGPVREAIGDWASSHGSRLLMRAGDAARWRGDVTVEADPELAERAREERRAELDAISGPKSEVGWGQAFRNYVLAPFQLVKDDRTKHETGNVTAVLDGDLDAFMEAYLRWRRRPGS